MTRPRYRRGLTATRTNSRVRRAVAGAAIGAAVMSVVALTSVPALAVDEANPQLPEVHTAEAGSGIDVVESPAPAVEQLSDAAPADIVTDVRAASLVPEKPTAENPAEVPVASPQSAAPASSTPADSTTSAEDSGPPRVTLSTSFPADPSGWITHKETWVQIGTWGWDGESIETITAVSSGAHDETVEWSGQLNASFQLKTPGESTVTVTAVDTAGRSTTQSMVVRYDPAVPTGRAHGLATDGTVGDTWTVDYSCADVGSGIETCEMVDYELGEVVTFTEPGRMQFHMRVVDKAGNVNYPDAWIDVVSADKTPPQLTVDIPAPSASGWHGGPVTVDFSAVDDEDGVFWMMPTVDGKPGSIVNGDHGKVTISGEGAHTLSVWANDTAGNNVTSETFDIKIDESAPRIEVGAEVEDASPPRDFQPVAATTFGQGDEVFFTRNCVDDVSWITECGGDLETDATLRTDVPGTFRIESWAVDAAGNRASSVFEYTVLAPSTGDPGGTDGHDGVAGPGEGPNSPIGVLAATGADPRGLIVGGIALSVIGAGALVLRRREANRGS